MKISTEIQQLKVKINKLIEDHVSYLMIGLEFIPESETWNVTPCYEGGGDGNPSYINNPVPEDGKPCVLQGNGNTLSEAINNLKDTLKKVKKQNLSLDRW